MAGALDIKHETIRIRREQAKRNREAVLEAEKRRAELKKEVGKPSDSRRRKIIPPSDTEREGHRLIHKTVPDSLESVAFASPVAQEMAEEAQLTAEVFEEYEPSGATGFTKKDVEEILADLEDEEEEEEDLDDDEDLDEDDEDFDDEDEDEDWDEEKMEDDDYEDKMDRGGENK